MDLISIGPECHQACVRFCFVVIASALAALVQHVMTVPNPKSGPFLQSFLDPLDLHLKLRQIAMAQNSARLAPWKSHREILPCGKTLQQPSKFGSPSYKSECGHQFFFNTTYGFTGPGLWRRCSSPSSRTTLQVMRKVTTQNFFSTPPGGTVACSACSAFATSPWAKIDPNQVKHSSSNGPKKIRPQACSSPVN